MTGSDADANGRERSPRRDRERKSKWDTEGNLNSSVFTSTPAQSSTSSGSMTNQSFRDMLSDPGLYAPSDPAAALYQAQKKSKAGIDVDPSINPLTNQPYSKRYWDIMEKRKTLPCAAAKKDFLKLVKKNPAVVLVGETGSGKTTQMPQFILDAGYSLKKFCFSILGYQAMIADLLLSLKSYVCGSSIA